MKAFLKLLKDNAKFNVTGGIALSLLGMLCIYMPFLTGITVAGIVSLGMIAYGISTSIFSFSKDKVWHSILSFIGGILITVLGVVMLNNPVTNLYSLAIIAVCYFIFDGIKSLVFTYELRKSKVWGWSLFNGIVSLILAGLLISQWPVSSFYIIGTLVGVRFIFSGFHIVLLASTSFGVVDAMEETGEAIDEAIEEVVDDVIEEIKEAKKVEEAKEVKVEQGEEQVTNESTEDKKA